jgi:hypothetical protein
MKPPIENTPQRIACKRATFGIMDYLKMSI